MGDGPVFQDRMLNYLNALSPEARALMARTVTPASASVDPTRVLLQAAGSTALPATHIVDVRRSRDRFFEPFQPFVIEEMLPARQPGFLHRDSFDGIWTYLVREAMPEAFQPWTDPYAAAVFADDREMRTALRSLRASAFAELVRLDRESWSDHKLRQRFISRMGGDRALQDFRDMLVLIDRLPAIERFLSRLPATIAIGESSERQLFDHVEGFLYDRPDDAVWLGAALCSKVGPVLLIRAAGAFAGSADPVDIRRSSAACFVDLALATIERSIMRYQAARQDPNEIAALVQEIRRYHETVRAIVSALDFDYDSTWRHRLAGLRSLMSDLIALDLEGMIPTVRRALQVAEADSPTAADAHDAIRATSILVAARWNRDSLALNDLVTRLTVQAEQAIEVLGNRLMDGLRRTHGARRTAIVSATDTLIRISELIYGEEHAGILRRSRDRAIATRSASSFAG